MTKQQYKEEHSKLQREYLNEPDHDKKEKVEVKIEELIMQYFNIKTFDEFDEAGGVSHGEKKFTSEIYKD